MIKCGTKPLDQFSHYWTEKLTNAAREVDLAASWSSSRN
jgi:hypothetical protein